MKQTTLLAIILSSTIARGESARELILLGNEAYKKDNFEEALTHYEEASVELPDSAQISFNRGTIYYKQEDYKEAIEHFKQASLRSKEPALASQAKFNLGNCAFRQAQRQRDSDLEKAIEYCRESISHYQEARDLNPSYQKAAENIEIVRLYVKVLLDAQKQQEDQKKEQEEDNLVAKLKKLLERQVELAQSNEDLADNKPAEIDPKGIVKWRDSLSEINAKQTTLMADTKAISEEIKQIQSQLPLKAATPPDPNQTANPQQQAQMEVFSKKLAEAIGHVNDAINQEQTVINHISSGKQNEALSAQEQAATDLSEAIKALSDDQKEQQPQQNQGQQERDDNQEQDKGKEKEEKQEQEKQQGQQDSKEQKPEKESQQSLTKMESADDILDEEKKNQKQKRPVRPGSIQRVERDW